MRAVIDLTGKAFGSWTPLERIGLNWRCRCRCGVESMVNGGNLRRGLTTSCGCHQRELAAKRATKHGQHRSPEWVTWCNMRNRCSNPKNKSYEQYGGRGISVCERWLGEMGFWNFIMDMGRRPTPDHSLDRIDNSKGYSPGNCRWADDHTQTRNKRSNVWVTAFGETLVKADWCKRLNIRRSSLDRCLKRGVSFEQAVARLQKGQPSWQP
jgi:hypothetical protein